MERVFITRRIPPAGIRLLESKYLVDVWEGELPPTHEQLVSRVQGVSGLLTMLSDKIDEGVIKTAGDTLKVIANYAVGYDNIDLKTASDCELQIGNTPGVLTETTANLAFALMLAVSRRYC